MNKWLFTEIKHGRHRIISFALILSSFYHPALLIEMESTFDGNMIQDEMMRVFCEFTRFLLL